MWILAWRNLWRNRTRSLITGTAIAATFGLMLISFGVADNLYARLMEAAAKAAARRITQDAGFTRVRPQQKGLARGGRDPPLSPKPGQFFELTLL